MMFFHSSYSLLWVDYIPDTRQQWSVQTMTEEDNPDEGFLPVDEETGEEAVTDDEELMTTTEPTKAIVIETGS